MSLFEVRVEIPFESAGSADEHLLENGYAAWSVLENVIEKRAWLVGVFGDEASARESWSTLSEGLVDAAIADAVVRELGESEWRDSYKAHFRPWQFGRLHWVPIWEKGRYTLMPGDQVLWLDPGLAFGTGNHETTRLCVERLVEVVGERGTCVQVVDAGCGSGILALSAARLGCEKVRAFDNDPEAVRVSEENAELNQLGGRVQFSVDDLSTGLKEDDADILLANILANVLMEYSAELTRAVAPGGVLVLSGILAAEREKVQNVFREAAPTWAQDTRTLGEWSDVVLSRPR